MEKEKTTLKEKLKQRFRAMVALNVSTRQLALACALGVFIGFSPYIGLHTIMAFAFSSIFKLPIYPILMGAHLSNPLTMPIIYPLTTELGMHILGVQAHFDFNAHDFNIKNLWEAGKPLLLSFWLGTHIVGAALSIFTYFSVYYIVRKYLGETYSRP
jgi:uncharacterized protein (DUF2062 family)